MYFITSPFYVFLNFLRITDAIICRLSSTHRFPKWLWNLCRINPVSDWISGTKMSLGSTFAWKLLLLSFLTYIFASIFREGCVFNYFDFSFWTEGEKLLAELYCTDLGLAFFVSLKCVIPIDVPYRLVLILRYFLLTICMFSLECMYDIFYFSLEVWERGISMSIFLLGCWWVSSYVILSSVPNLLDISSGLRQSSLSTLSKPLEKTPTLTGRQKSFDFGLFLLVFI